MWLVTWQEARRVGGGQTRPSRFLTLPGAHICVELSDKAGEVVMLEVEREKVPGKLSGAPHYEAARTAGGGAGSTRV